MVVPEGDEVLGPRDEIARSPRRREAGLRRTCRGQGDDHEGDGRVGFDPA